MTSRIKTILFIAFLLLLKVNLHAQNNELWTAFYNKDSTAVGFKDARQVVQIEPKFNFNIQANYFRNIIAVVEHTQEGKWKSYYLTKAGKKVGQDSLHIYDNGFDCETEGFIRFKDHEHDKTGLFDKNGAVVIPATYNELSRVSNGMLIALKGAEKKQSRDGEHYSWSGGQELLIDTNNTVLIENFAANSNLNFFSLKITDAVPIDSVRTSFLGTDGSYYSFIDYDKEFKQWLENDLLNNLTIQKLVDTSNETISWETADSWMKTDRQSFITNNFKVLKNNLLEIKKPNADYFIYNSGLNNFIFDDDSFKKYYNDCGESIDNKYPTLSIVISHGKRKRYTQNNFEFLRTDEGYKLISVTIRNGRLK